MKKLLLVALFVAVPALVLAQGTTTTTPTKSEPTKVEAKKTTATVKTEAAKPAATEAAKTETKKTETATTKTTETTKTATTETAKTTPEMILVGEVVNYDSANKMTTIKEKDTNKEVKFTLKETLPNYKTGLKIKATYEKDANGKLWLKKFEEVQKQPATTTK